MRCNLKCQLCGVLVPHYDFRPQMLFEEFSDTLSAVFQIVDYVGKVQITGGEPMLHPQLDKFLAECFEYDGQFKELWLFTNCAVPFRPAVLDVLKAHKAKVMVHCSDYGVRPEIASEILRVLEEREIPYKYLKYYGDNQYFDGWVDNGDFVAHHRSREENEEIFRKCSHVCRGGSWYVRNGQIHWCGRSIRGTELGKIPIREEDYVDIFDINTTIEEKRDKLKKLKAATCISACDYCNGYYGTEDKSKRYPAGGQMKC